MFKEILSKVTCFEEGLLIAIKQKILDNLIKKETPKTSSKWYLIHCVLLGVTTANIINSVFITKDMSFLLSLISFIYTVVGGGYVTAYLKRNKTKKSVIENIKDIKNIKELYKYVDELEDKYLYSDFLFNKEKIREFIKELSYISQKDVKALLSNLNEEEINQIKDIFKYNLNEKNFNIDLIEQIIKRCKQEIEKKEKEELFDKILKDKVEDEKDLLDLMLEECSSEKAEKLKINFKEVL